MSDPSRKRGLPVQVKMRHDTHFVEELAARHEAPVGKMIPLSAIEPDPHQPRSSMGDLEDLVASIRAKGVLEPILVRPRPQTVEELLVGPAYRIISGERRYRAAQEAGLYEVPAIEMDVSEDEALEIALIENLQRKDLTPFEEAEGFRRSPLAGVVLRRRRRRSSRLRPRRATSSRRRIISCSLPALRTSSRRDLEVMPRACTVSRTRGVI